MNILFIIKVKNIVLIEWSSRDFPDMLSTLNIPISEGGLIVRVGN